MSEQERRTRRERLSKLRADGVDPYPARVGPREPIAAVRAAHDSKDAAALEAERPRAAVAGRLLALRSFGKLAFLVLREDGSELQVSVQPAELEARQRELFEALDVGDFVRAEGRVWRTRKGELTVAAERLDLLAKSVRPLPEKWHGLQDVERRFRQRYLDLLVNEDARRAALLRSRTISALRAFLDGRGFLEVETPVLQPLYGGAAARPFVTHHNAYDQELFLRISDELYLKRLVIGGLDRVYEIGHNFRNEGVSRKHNPEFTMMECYQAYADFRDMMDLVQDMFQFVVGHATGGTRVAFQGQEIEFGGAWPRLSMREAILDRTGLDVFDSDHERDLGRLLLERGVQRPPTWGVLVDTVFSEVVEPTLVQPTFITHHPVETSPLAKRAPENPRLVERFEVFVAGMELGNAFSELNDPEDQRARFEAARLEAAAGDEEAHPMDEDFLLALEHGMPPTGGLGVGVDRLVMVLADAPSLREVLLFPHMKPEQDG